MLHAQVTTLVASGAQARVWNIALGIHKCSNPRTWHHHGEVQDNYVKSTPHNSQKQCRLMTVRWQCAVRGATGHLLLQSHIQCQRSIRKFRVISSGNLGMHAYLFHTRPMPAMLYGVELTIHVAKFDQRFHGLQTTCMRRLLACCGVPRIVLLHELGIQDRCDIFVFAEWLHYLGSCSCFTGTGVWSEFLRPKQRKARFRQHYQRVIQPAVRALELNDWSATPRVQNHWGACNEELHSCYVMEYPLPLPNGGFSSNCKVTSRYMVFPLLALGVSAPFVTSGSWRTLIIYFFDATLLNPVWGHCAILIRSLVEPWDPIENVSKMCWLGYMRSNFADEPLMMWPRQQNLLLLQPWRICQCFWISCSLLFFLFLRVFLPVFLGTGSELWRWRAMCCMWRGLWQNLGSCDFCFFVRYDLHFSQCHKMSCNFRAKRSSLETSSVILRGARGTSDVSHCLLYTPRSALYTPHSALHPFHFTLHTLHTTLHTLHFTLYTLHSTLYTPHSTLHTPHFTLHTPYPTLRALHFTLHTQHFTLHTLHSRLCTPHSTLYTLHLALCTPHFTRQTPHSALYTSYTPHFTLHAPYPTLQSLHFTLHTLHATLLHIPKSTVHWSGATKNMYKTVQTNFFTKVFHVTAFPCVSTSVPFTYV